jgi:hypothetical protein
MSPVVVTWLKGHQPGLSIAKVPLFHCEMIRALWGDLRDCVNIAYVHTLFLFSLLYPLFLFGGTHHSHAVRKPDTMLTSLP